MLIKAKKQLIPQTLQDFSYDSLKKQIILYPVASSLTKSQKKQQQYLQVNYLQNFVYKVDPESHRRVPPLKQEQNFRDYLLEVRHDQERILHANQELKDRFFKFLNKDIKPSHSNKKKRKLSDLAHSRRVNQTLQIYDPIQHLQHKKIQKQKRQKRKTKLKEPLTFLNQVESVKYLDDYTQTNFLTPLPQKQYYSSNPSLANRKTSARISHYSDSIQQLLQKSVKYQSPSKNGTKKLKNFKSRLQLLKDNQKIVNTQRNKIMKMIGQKSKSPETKRLQYKSLNQIPAHKKYEMDFISYSRTKTKQSLDKLIYQKLIKRPEKDLQKFQQFILKQVKFQNQQNKHKIQRFFIKMRQEFRRIQKYGKQGSKFDWRTKSTELQQIRNDKLAMLKISKIFDDINLPNSKISQSSKEIIKKRQLRNRNSSISRSLKPINQIINKRDNQQKTIIQEDYPNLKQTESEIFYEQVQGQKQVN